MLNPNAPTPRVDYVNQLKYIYGFDVNHMKKRHFSFNEALINQCKSEKSEITFVKFT